MNDRTQILLTVPNVTATVEMIGPQQATRLLASFVKNRARSKRNLVKIERSMKTGTFRFNGEPIIVSDKGHGLDGEHRLACVESSGVTLPFLVVRGVPEEAFVTMGRGKPRSTSDVLGIDGHTNTHRLGALARTVYLYENRMLGKEDGGAITKSGSGYGVSVEDIRFTIQMFPKLPEAISQARRLHGRSSTFHGFDTAASFIVHAHMVRPTEGGKIFLEQMTTKIGWTDTSPSYTLDRTLGKVKSGSKTNASSFAVLALCIKAFHAAQNDRPMSQIRFGANDDFPYLLQLG